MNKKLLIAGSFLGGIGIILGAFAAHGLEPLLSSEDLRTFETGVRYEMYSAFFLLFLACLPMISEKTKNACFYLTVIGTILFSGSIYLLATNSLTNFDFGVIALATPLGGFLIIMAWVLLLINSVKLKNK
ncbi:MAG TPA: DUF423 domain-containing protein [Salinimicrobium sp.]|nr:DUF423 domain-containing protein [Salinimicrobium sp.]